MKKTISSSDGEESVGVLLPWLWCNSWSHELSSNSICGWMHGTQRKKNKGKMRHESGEVLVCNENGIVGREWERSSLWVLSYSLVFDTFKNKYSCPGIHGQQKWTYCFFLKVFFWFRNALSGHYFNLIDLLLIYYGSQVSVWVFCVQKCVSWCLYVFLVLFLWIFFYLLVLSCSRLLGGCGFWDRVSHV